MFRILDESKPVFQQIKEMIEDDIVKGVLKEEEQIPSINQLVAYYKINPATILKGFNLLVDEEIIYKKRGVGMFVKSGAYKKIKNRRTFQFEEQYVEPLLQEAQALDISMDELIQIIERKRGTKKWI